MAHSHHNLLTWHNNNGAERGVKPRKSSEWYKYSGWGACLGRQKAKMCWSISGGMVSIGANERSLRRRLG